MAWKLELKEKAKALKSAGVKERFSIDWKDSGITHIGWVDVTEYTAKETKTAKK